MNRAKLQMVLQELLNCSWALSEEPTFEENMELHELYIELDTLMFRHLLTNMIINKDKQK